MKPGGIWVFLGEVAREWPESVGLGSTIGALSEVGEVWSKCGARAPPSGPLTPPTQRPVL